MLPPDEPQVAVILESEMEQDVQLMEKEDGAAAAAEAALQDDSRVSVLGLAPRAVCMHLSVEFAPTPT